MNKANYVDDLEIIDGSRSFKGYLGVFFATILFSSMEVALKGISDDFNPMQMTFIRFFIGGLFLCPIALGMARKKHVKIPVKAMKKFALLGFIGVVVNMTFYQIAVMNGKASVIAVLFSCNPIFVTLFAWLILKEKIEKRSYFAIAFQIIGIVLIVDPWDFRLNVIGLVCILLAAVAFGLYGVLGKKESEEYGGVIATCLSFLFGSLEMFLIIVLSHFSPFAIFLENHKLNVFANIPIIQGLSYGNIGVVLFVSIGVTGMGYASYFLAMEYIEAQQASLVFFFKPVLAPIFAMILLSEAIPVNMVIGIVLIIIGSLISILFRPYVGLTEYFIRGGLDSTEKYRMRAGSIIDEHDDALHSFRIIQISDLQSDAFGQEQGLLREAIKKGRGDLIVITGDFIDCAHTDWNMAYKAMDVILSFELPVFYAFGNHERRLNKGELDEFINHYKDKVQFLSDSGAEFKKGDCTVAIGGLNQYAVDASREFRRKNPVYKPMLIEESIDKAFEKVDDDKEFKILLAHEPQLFNIYARCDFNLVLTGHAHGGQFRIPGLGGLYAPEQGVFPKYTAGVHWIKDGMDKIYSGKYMEKNGDKYKWRKAMVISRGLGNSKFPFRLFNRPEVVCINVQLVK